MNRGSLRSVGERIAIVIVIGVFAVHCNDEGEPWSTVLLRSPQWSTSYIAVLRTEAHGTSGPSGCNSVESVTEPTIPVFDVYRADSTGRIIGLVASGKPNVSVLRWSPAGDRLFVGSAEPWLGSGAFIVMIGGGVTVIDSLVTASDAVWTGDGSRVIVSGIRVGDTERRVYILNADGSGLRLLDASLPSEVNHLAWSGRGTLALLYHKDYRGYLGFADTSGAGFAVIDSIGLVYSVMAMSPDGTDLVYTSASAPNRIYRLSIGSTTRTEISQGPYVSSIAYSPDGSTIMYGVDGGVYVVGADGTNEHLVTPYAREASWSPDSRKLVFSTSDHLEVVAVR